MRIPSIALLAALLLPLPALADSYTYTYTGNDFTTVAGNYALGDSVTGGFTLSAPLPGSTYDTAIPALFSFSDGTQTITNSNSTSSDLAQDHFLVETDASGDIVTWGIQFFQQSNGSSIYTGNFSGAVQDLGSNGNSGLSYAHNDGDAGTWAVTDNPAITPEPSSFILLGTGLAGAFVLSRRAAHV